MTSLTPQQSGRLLESALERLHALYRRDQLAVIEHMGTQAAPFTDPETGKTYWEPQSSQPDYAGCLWGGRLVKFDAKSCSEDTYRHPKKTRHQLIRLWDYHEAHALCGLLVCNLQEECGWWITPQPEWAVGQFAPIRLNYHTPHPMVFNHPACLDGWLPDWLEAVMEAQKR